MNKQIDLDKCICLIARQDDVALGILYEELADPIFRFSLMILGDAYLAEDAMQNTFVKIMKNTKLYKRGTSPKSWIFTIVRNVSMDLYKKKLPVVDDSILNSFPDDRSVENLADFISIRDAVNKLTIVEKEILSLYIFAGIKQIEIAKIMQISYIKVRSHYKYAIQKLRKELGE